ncbi:hypothetical protein [Actinoplanes rectilineatus]|uniref:hypothetical protein n=1 Tax=Actinoplanes rectilineatus TaxID=113571 RepID=UPI0005F2CC38|nr:hypothetical protein [Actinoplanes rectilineatus]
MDAVPELTFRSGWPDDEHAFCPCGSPVPMSFNAATGRLECDDCLTAAVDAAAIVAEVAS